MNRFIALSILVSAFSFCAARADTPWQRHTIDNTSRGADGVRLHDVNGDKLPDIVTGWEEGGVIRAYLHPGFKNSKRAWPKVTVGNVRSPEDAVFVDLDGDGAVDVVSSCEGRTKTVFVHWAPIAKGDYLNAKKWTTAAFPVTKNLTRWMFAVPMQVDGKHGVDLVIGSKNPNAQIGWLEAPKNPRDVSAWKWHTIHKAGWIMSLFAIDIDGDGDTDIVTTDRKGPKRGCYWLENPGTSRVCQASLPRGASSQSITTATSPCTFMDVKDCERRRTVGKGLLDTPYTSLNDQTKTWKAHPIGGLKREVMFVKPCDLDGDKRQDFVIAVKGGDILFCKRTADKTPKWTEHGIQSPANIGTGKAVAVGDLDGDGRQDIVLSCENAKNASGVVWLSRPKGKPATHREWIRHEISGNKRGIKFDRIELLDLDGDGDLDVLTCEERHNLGVIWYANPGRDKVTR